MEVKYRTAASVVALSVDYGQSHQCELVAASALTRHYQGVEHRIVSLRLPTQRGCIAGQVHRPAPDGEISPHYVPGRNTVLLGLALSCAESVGATRIIIGPTQADQAGFPDCRHSFFRAWQVMANVATASTERITIETPLLTRSKVWIGRECKRLKVPLDLTWSCYNGGITGGSRSGPAHCGECNACINRLTVCLEAGVGLEGKP